MAAEEPEWQSVDNDIPQEVRVISERPTTGVTTPIITVESLQRYIEDERNRNKQALLWTSTLFLFVVLLVLVMFLSVGIYVLRRTRETGDMVVSVRQQAKKQTTAITHIAGKLEHVAALQTEVKDAVQKTEERRVRNEQDIKKNLERFGKWVSARKKKEHETLAEMQQKIQEIEKARKKNAEEFANMRKQYLKLQETLVALEKSGSMNSGQNGDLLSMANLSGKDNYSDIATKDNPLSGVNDDVGSTLNQEDRNSTNEYLSGDELDGKLAMVNSGNIPDVTIDSDNPAVPVKEISVVTFPNGDRYEGSFKNGLFDGWGVYYYHNGDKYEGEFKNNMKDGKGTLTFSNGDKYVGEFKDDMMSGYGSFSYANGDRYVGQFARNMRNGKGTFIYANGNKYTGGFRNGKKSGNGIFQFANGDVYRGEFLNDARNGKGTYSYASGAKYIGEFRNGRRNGKGRYIYESGEEYIGEFKNGMKDGFGMCVYPNGAKLKGEWHKNKFYRRIK